MGRQFVAPPQRLASALGFRRASPIEVESTPGNAIGNTQGCVEVDRLRATWDLRDEVLSIALSVDRRVHREVSMYHIRKENVLDRYRAVVCVDDVFDGLAVDEVDSAKRIALRKCERDAILCSCEEGEYSVVGLWVNVPVPVLKLSLAVSAEGNSFADWYGCHSEWPRWGNHFLSKHARCSGGKTDDEEYERDTASHVSAFLRLKSARADKVEFGSSSSADAGSEPNGRLAKPRTRRAPF